MHFPFLVLFQDLAEMLQDLSRRTKRKKSLETKGIRLIN